MAKFLDTPDFSNEQEEAEWWDSPEGRASILQGFDEADREGTITDGSQLRQILAEPSPTVRLYGEDAELARVQAQQLGLSSQAYLEGILHEALRQNAAHS